MGKRKTFVREMCARLFSALSQRSRVTVKDKVYSSAVNVWVSWKLTASLPPEEINQSPTSCTASYALPSPFDQSVHVVLTNVSINSVRMASKINTVSFHQTVLLAFLSPSFSLSWPLPLFFSALSTNSNTLSCTKWMGLLCWSLFSSVESSSSLTSTTSMAGMSVFPSLFFSCSAVWLSLGR